MKIINSNFSKNFDFWEDAKNSSDFIWRYTKNPIIKSNATSISNSVFNSAVTTYKNGYAGVFRCDNKAIEMNIFAGFSNDGINWKIAEKPIEFNVAKGVDKIVLKSDYKYDPRITKIDDTYYISWCNGYMGCPTIGLGYTKDFKKFYALENAFLPFNRNGVLFPKKINGEFAMLSRPSDNGHTPFGDIFYSTSKDLTYWGKHRFVMGALKSNEQATSWQRTKIGAGPTPIETDKGYLLFYHGVLNAANGFVYSFGVALLDKDKPYKVIKRSKDYLLHPSKMYERVGDVPNVVFPCSALSDSKTGKIVIYYGSADTVTSIAFTTAQKIAHFLDKHSI
jgi:beta-1,4-mannooligosaccharide/beta-1,4-mannosyl-N-acetylglucosamine phosphorylase